MAEPLAEVLDRDAPLGTFGRVGRVKVKEVANLILDTASSLILFMGKLRLFSES